jgi:antirestriction protein
MFQDFECFPKQWYSESHINDAFWDLKDDLSGMSEDMYNAFLAFMDVHGPDDIDADALAEFHDKFQGFYDSQQDFAQRLAEEFGFFSAMERIGLNASYFDVEQYAVDLFHSYYFDSDTGAVFTR